MSARPTIELANIRKVFGTKQVLSDIDLAVGCGNIVGLLGPSGAGKTTMLKIMVGLTRPTSGSVTVLGKDPVRFRKRDYAKIGIVLDQGGLYERLSCKDNLRVFSYVHGVRCLGSIQAALSKVGLGEEGSTRAESLSKGMAQRLKIARALLHNPELLFFDEPTSGLDPATAEGIRRLILEARDEGKTVFLATHNMEEAAKLCDEVFLLDEGVIVEHGSPQTLCRSYSTSREIVIWKEGRRYSFSDVNTDAKSVCEVLSSGGIESVRTADMNLESVFLSLTGKGLG